MHSKTIDILSDFADGKLLKPMSAEPWCNTVPTIHHAL